MTAPMIDRGFVLDRLAEIRAAVATGQAHTGMARLDDAIEAISTIGSEGRPEQRNTHEVLASIANLLEELLAEAKRSNSTAREGAVSSVEIKFLANGTPQPTIKAYAGSEPPVEEALDAYGRTIRESNARALADWSATVDGLAAEKVTADG